MKEPLPHCAFVLTVEEGTAILKGRRVFFFFLFFFLFFYLFIHWSSQRSPKSELVRVVSELKSVEIVFWHRAEKCRKTREAPPFGKITFYLPQVLVRSSLFRKLFWIASPFG
jgi:hypothetical protein